MLRIVVNFENWAKIYMEGKVIEGSLEECTF